MATTTETFEFNFKDDEIVDRSTIIFQAIGAGSLCWESMEGTGVFESDRARAIGEAALVELRKIDGPLLGLATTDVLLAELKARFHVDRIVNPDDARLAMLEAGIDTLSDLVRQVGNGGYRTVDS